MNHTQQNGNHLIYKNPKQTQGTSKVTICPLNKKEKKLSSWTVRQSHLKTGTIIFRRVFRSPALQDTMCTLRTPTLLKLHFSA